MQRLRKGDDVVVLSGVHKGARGAIESVVYNDAREVTHVVIDGVNKRWKHSRGNPRLNDPGGRVEKTMPLPACKVALYNDEKGGPDRIRIVTGEDGKRRRVFATGGKEIE